MKFFLSIVLLSALLIMPGCKSMQDNPSITAAEIEAHLAFLASDSLKGRYPGTSEDQILVDYIIDEYQRTGLSLLAENGLQPFEIVMDLRFGDSLWFRAGTLEAILEKDFVPAGFSASKDAAAPLVFAGFGHVDPSAQDPWDDYKDLDIYGSWVLVLDDLPDFLQDSGDENYLDDRNRAMVAADRGASGLVIILGAEKSLPELEKEAAPVNIPVIYITRSLGISIFQEAGQDLRVLEKRLIQERKSSGMELGMELSARVELVEETSTTCNTMALLEGSDEQRKDEIIVLGAHHDHLGMGGFRSSSRQPDTSAVHYGADDNASGVSLVLEISEYLAALDPAPRRSILFMTFGAEEQGLYGSKYYTQNPAFPLDQTYAMLNMDMVGRLNEDARLQIGGVGTAKEFNALLDGFSQKDSFKLARSSEGFGPSDHAAFYAQDIPVLFFSTGAHSDYHTPRDNIEGINTTGMVRIGEALSVFVTELANRDSALTFTEAGPKERTGRRYADMKATLGIMPDITADPDYDGMRIEFVTPGKPASRAGLKKGDIIQAIEGEAIGNVYDYMYRMKNYRSGQQIIVRVSRDEESLDFLVEL